MVDFGSAIKEFLWVLLQPADFFEIWRTFLKKSLQVAEVPTKILLLQIRNQLFSGFPMNYSMPYEAHWVRSCCVTGIRACVIQDDEMTADFVIRVIRG